MAGDVDRGRHGVRPGGRAARERRPLARRLGACRAWGRLLRDNGRETQALDVLDKAAELGMRAAPEAAHLKS